MDPKELEIMQKLLKATATVNEKDHVIAQAELAKALTTPLRQGIMPGEIYGGIFEMSTFDVGNIVEYPLDFLAPGTEKEYVAFSVPNHGYIPENSIEGDFVTVPTYRIAYSIDWLVRWARDARWDIVRRAMQVFEAAFGKKINDDAWHLLLTAGVDRNIVVSDSDASVGLFTKRLVSLMKTVMRRNGGGNSTSINRSRLTDMYMSPENQEDMRNWGVDQIDEVTRREIYQAADGTLSRIFGVNIHDLDELGESQEYQNYFTNELAASLASTDVELVIGLDLSKNDSFVMPIRQPLQMHEDASMLRQGRTGVWGDVEIGLGVLDSRRIILGSD